MSELATTVTPAEPTSLESVIESSLAESYPDRATESTDAPESSHAEDQSTHEPPAVPVTTPTAQTVVDELAAALGLSPKPASDIGGKWFSQRVPYSKVKKIVEERETAAKKAHDDALKGHTEKITAYEAELQRVARVEQLMDDPDRFIAAISQHHPNWARFKQPGAPTQQTPQSGMPTGDLADGSYSQAGLQRLLDWNAAQVEARVTQRIAPIEREQKSRELFQQAQQRVDAQLQEASKWPLFTESQADIMAAMQKDPRLTLEAAYRATVFPKMTASRESIRAEVLAELQRRPHSTSVTSSTAGQAPVTPATDIEDVIRQSIRGS